MLERRTGDGSSHTQSFQRVSRMASLTTKQAPAPSRGPSFSALRPERPSWLAPNRRLAAALGVCLLLLLALAEGRQAEAPVALAAFATLGLAAAYGWLELRRDASAKPWITSCRTVRGGKKAWSAAAISIATIGTAAVGTWFRGTSGIGGGDLVPPFGVGWIGRLFEPWVWSGSDLGAPAAGEVQAPWAAVLGAVHVAGGSGALAQRLWVTGLFVCAGIAALLLLRALNFSPLAAFCGAVVYMFNPYAVSWVGASPVYLAALVLLPGLPALVLTAARERCRPWVAGLLIALAAPLLGYISQVPPLLGMVMLTLFVTPLFAALMGGRAAAARGWHALLIGVPLLLVFSLYWVVPSIVQLDSVATGSLAGLDTWSFAEVRSTLGNAFWLNTMWAWAYSYYVSYAPAYSELPLSLLKMLLPVVAFGALALSTATTSRRSNLTSGAHLRIAVVAATVALVLIFLSTGTRPPAGAVFSRIYQLPLGWLLREPGRFLMLAGLAYTLLVAIVVDTAAGQGARVGMEQREVAALREMQTWRRRRRMGAASIERARRWFSMMRGSRRVRALAVVAVISSVTLGVGFPLIVGAIVPDARGYFPSGHVQLPGYWDDMAQFVNKLPQPGGLVVLPPDDFYQMPYRWGYYGSDEFVPQMFSRRTLIPSPQGYFASSIARSAVQVASDNILGHNWEQAKRVLGILNTPLILVRGDVTSFPNRSILAPEPFAKALRAAPGFRLLRRSGPLQLFATSVTSPPETEIADGFATVATQHPNLDDLVVLPARTHLISAPPNAGDPVVIEPPELESWKQDGADLEQTVALPAGWRYQLYALSSTDQASSAAIPASDGVNDLHGLHIVTSYGSSGSPGARTEALTLPLPSSRLLDSSFDDGGWSAVKNCKTDVNSTGPILAGVSSGVEQNVSTSVLRLSATNAIACEARSMPYHGGSLLVTMLIKRVAGEDALVCLFQDATARRCAPGSAVLQPSPQNPGWSMYRAVLNPDPDTRQLSIFLSAPAGVSETTTDEFTQVQVTPLPMSHVVYIGQPEKKRQPVGHLVVMHEAYSDRWAGRPGAHVLADGLLNGWLITEGRTRFAVDYAPASAISTAFLSSAVAGAVVVGLLVEVAIARWIGHRLRRR